MTENTRDAIIGGGVLVAIILAYIYVAEPWLANQAAQTTADQSSATALGDLQPNSVAAASTPITNLPPTLVLPPYNVGNVPPSMPQGNATSGGSSSDCGCESNACGTNYGQGSAFSQLLNFWNSNAGIVDGPSLPAGSTDTLTVPATISVPPEVSSLYYNTYPIWAAKEGFSPPNPNINANTHQEDTIPGSQQWNGQQQWTAYNTLQGALFRNASPALQQAVMTAVYKIAS
jgi:hypothetical protein